MTKKWCVRFCTDDREVSAVHSINFVTPAFVECLRYAELVTSHDTDRQGYTFDLEPPAGYDTEQTKT